MDNLWKNPNCSTWNILIHTLYTSKLWITWGKLWIIRPKHTVYPQYGYKPVDKEGYAQGRLGTTCG